VRKAAPNYSGKGKRGMGGTRPRLEGPRIQLRHKLHSGKGTQYSEGGERSPDMTTYLRGAGRGAQFTFSYHIFIEHGRKKKRKEEKERRFQA